MKCPSCDSSRVFPSRFKTLFERLRHRLTDKQPYRCHDCGRRQWRAFEVSPPQPDIRPEDLRTGRRTNPVGGGDLDPLDPKTGP